MQEPMGKSNVEINDMQEEEQYEDEISQIAGHTRQSDGVMRTPYRSVTPVSNNPLGQGQFQPGGRLEEVYGKNYNLRNPVDNEAYFQDEQLNQDIQDDNRPRNVRIPKNIEGNNNPPPIQQDQKAPETILEERRNIRGYKQPVPSHLPNDQKYQKFQNLLQEDEEDLKKRFEKGGDAYDKIDMDEKYDVNRKKNKTDRPAPYKDPFKAHMMNMQNKLIYGPDGKPPNASTLSVNESPNKYGGFADPSNIKNQSYITNPRQLANIPPENNQTLSLPQIKREVDTMEGRMEHEIDRELKLRKDAKNLIITAVRKNPTLDRNVKAWLKTEKESNSQLNEGQVFTQQYRKLIYQEIKKEKNSFPVMNQYLEQGLVKVSEEEKNKNVLAWAKLKYKMDMAPKSALAIREEQIQAQKFDYEKVKVLYNVSLLDSELLDPVAFLLKKKQDAKTTIMHVFKRKYEEKQIHVQLADPKTLKKDRPILEEKLRVIHTAIELCRQRLEWVLFDTPFTIKQLEEEINHSKAGTSDPEIQKEKEMMKQFLKDHKVNQLKQQEVQQKARDARNLLNIQILEVRALKNRTGCETIADFVLMFRELIHMERLETAKVLLQDALVNKKKTEEFFNLIKKIISYEDEMIKLRADFANEQFIDQKLDQNKFVNYDEVVLSKIDMANKEDFAQQFKQEKLIFPFIPFWYTSINGVETNHSEILRKMLKLKLPEAKQLCNFLGCISLNEFTTYMRHNKRVKEYIIFDNDDLQYFRRQYNIDENILKGFANLISILAKEFLMVPKLLFDLAKPSQMEEVNLSDFNGEHLSSDAISAIVACIQNFQTNIKRMIFKNCQIDSKGAQLFKFLLSDEKKMIMVCDFDNNNLQDPGIDQIMSGIKNNPKGDIRILKFGNNNLSITAAIRLAHVLKTRAAHLPKINLQVLKMSHNQIGDIGCETLIGFVKKNQSLKYLDISFNKIGDRGLLAVAESFKENDKLEVINLLGNEFTNRSIRFIGEALAENKRSKLSIMKIGNFTCDAEVFQTFLNQGFSQSALLKYMYITSNQYMNPMIKKLQDSEGENPKSLVVTENYDPKLDSTMLVDLMSQICELEIFQNQNTTEVYKFGEQILYNVIKEKYGNSNLEVLIYLFQYIFGPDHILSDNISPMHLFAKFGSIEAMYYCLRLKVSPNFKTSIAFQEYPSATSLHIAAGYSQLEMCKFLLTSGLTDVNCKDLHSNTPLHYAGISGSNQLAMILIQYNASCLLQNKKKMLPLHSCIFSDHIVTFKTILMETDKQLAKQFVGKQIEKAMDLKTYNSFTPLMLALEEKADNIFAYLVENGADLKAQDEEGNSILHRALMGKKNKQAKYLIKQGADIFQRTFGGETPIMMAVRNGMQDLVRLIALKGGDLYEKNFKGDSLLHLAARMDQAEVIGYLLDKGLQTLDVNRDGQRPMDLAVRPAIKQLLSLENPKTHDIFKNQQTYGNDLQERIRTDDLDRKPINSAQDDEVANARELEEQKKNGRLLNQAIIKYRIEKKDIVDSAYRSKLGQFSAAGQSQMSIGQDANGNKFGQRNSLYGNDDEEELNIDDQDNKKDRNFNLKQAEQFDETEATHPMHSKGLAGQGMNSLAASTVGANTNKLPATLPALKGKP